MSQFMHGLDLAWKPIVLALTGLLCFYLGKRFTKGWRRKYNEALANRQEWLALRADAQLRASTQSHVEVNVSPNINVGDGNINTLAASQREETNDYRSAFCPFCGRFGCRADCREALTDGPRGIPQLHDQLGAPNARNLDRPTHARLPRNSDPHRLLHVGRSDDAGYLADDDPDLQYFDYDEDRDDF
jgi:hypothetical protein